MSHNNGKLAFALSLLLILSQWLSLAHATEHSVDSDDVYCQVCTLQHQFQAATLNVLSGLTVVAPNSCATAFKTHLYTGTPDPASSIRAPPL